MEASPAKVKVALDNCPAMLCGLTPSWWESFRLCLGEGSQKLNKGKFPSFQHPFWLQF